MTSRWSLFVPCVVLLAFGCSRPPGPTLQPGDVVRPEASFAPEAPWPAGAEVTVGVLLRVERPGGETRYLMDEDVDIERAVTGVRVTFFDGGRVVGEPREVPLVHDC